MTACKNCKHLCINEDGPRTEEWDGKFSCIREINKGDMDCSDFDRK